MARKSKPRKDADADADGAEAEDGVLKRMVTVQEKVTPWFTTVWVYIGLVFAVLTIFFWQLAIRYTSDLSTPKKRWKAHQRMLSVWHNVFGGTLVSLNPFWDRKVEMDTPEEDIPKPVIYMANHTSFADSIMFSGMLPNEPTAVGKSELFDLPIFGTIVKNNGMLPIAFVKKNGRWTTDHKSIERMFKKAEEKLKYGTPIIVFPEGKISLDGEVKKFKPGFFLLSLKTNTPILPFGAWGNHRVLRMKEDHRGASAPEPLLYPGKCSVRLGTPIYPLEAIDFENDDTLMSLIQAALDDDSCPLTAEDFEEANQDMLGGVLADGAPGNEKIAAIHTAFVDKLMKVTRGEIVEIVDDLKSRHETEEEEKAEWISDTDKFILQKQQQLLVLTT